MRVSILYVRVLSVAALLAVGAACVLPMPELSAGGGDSSYESVVIGGKTWMVKNMNVPTAESWCYGDAEENCEKYGRLYTWAAAKSVCPRGWKLPDTADWRRLFVAVGGENTAGEKLKSTSGWHNDGNGTDEFGFSALAGGQRYSGSFNNLEREAHWWAATEYSNDAYAAFMYYMYDYARVSPGKSKTSYGLSVRCVKY